MERQIRAITSAKGENIQRIFIKYGSVTLTLGYVHLLGCTFWPDDLPEKVSYEKSNGATVSQEAIEALGFAIQAVNNFDQL